MVDSKFLYHFRVKTQNLFAQNVKSESFPPPQFFWGYKNQRLDESGGDPTGSC